MSNETLTNQLSRAKQLIAGTGKHYVNGSQTIQVAGATFTVTALTQFMQNFVDNRESVEASKAATKAKIEAEPAYRPFAAIRRLALLRERLAEALHQEPDAGSPSPPCGRRSCSPPIRVFGKPRHLVRAAPPRGGRIEEDPSSRAKRRLVVERPSRDDQLAPAARVMR